MYVFQFDESGIAFKMFLQFSYISERLISRWSIFTLAPAPVIACHLKYSWKHFKRIVLGSIAQHVSQCHFSLILLIFMSTVHRLLIHIPLNSSPQDAPFKNEYHNILNDVFWPKSRKIDLKIYLALVKTHYFLSPFIFSLDLMKIKNRSTFAKDFL